MGKHESVEDEKRLLKNVCCQIEAIGCSIWMLHCCTSDYRALVGNLICVYTIIHLQFLNR